MDSYCCLRITMIDESNMKRINILEAIFLRSSSYPAYLTSIKVCMNWKMWPFYFHVVMRNGILNEKRVGVACFFYCGLIGCSKIGVSFRKMGKWVWGELLQAYSSCSPFLLVVKTNSWRGVVKYVSPAHYLCYTVHKSDILTECSYRFQLDDESKLLFFLNDRLIVHHITNNVS